MSKFLDVYASSTLVLIVIYLLGILIINTSFSAVQNAKKMNKSILSSLISEKYLLFLIAIIGFVLRLSLTTSNYNGDIDAFRGASTFMGSHIYNVYAHTNGYNYSPLIFFVFSVLGLIERATHILTFPFTWRLLLSIFDLCSLFLLVKIASYNKINPIKTAFLFSLNPVSIIVSGHHGQFENIAIFFLLLAVFFHYKTNSKKQSGLLKWFYLTISLLIKHIIVFQLLVFWRSEVKKNRKIILIFLSSIFVFLLSFVPYWFGAKEQIVKNVFLYGGVPGDYGITYFLIRWFPGVTVLGLYPTVIYKYTFMILLFTIPFFIQRKNLIRNMLFMFLFFVTFTSGIGIQYFVLPIAFGALFPSKWFYSYTIIVCMSYIGGLEQFLPHLMREFSFISFNTVWIFSLLWFGSELLYVSKTARMIYHKLIDLP